MSDLTENNKDVEISSLIGKAEHQLDENGRMRIPAKFSGEFGKQIVVMPTFRGCLCLFTGANFAKFSNSVNSRVFPDEEEAYAMNALLDNSEKVESDNQGRYRIPSTLLEHAGITKDMVITGKLTYLEVWDKAVYDERFGGALSKQNIKSVYEKLKKLGV